MAGYHGWSMSNNAVDAYDSGEKPKSKWTKAEIVEQVAEFGAMGSDELSKYPKAALFEVFCCNMSWHHTGKLYKETDFYSIDEEAAADRGSLERLAKVVKDMAAGKEAPEPTEKIRLVWEEWVGSRNHGRFERFEDYAIKAGNTAYLPDGRGKRLDGAHIVGVEKLKRAPKGTAEIFKRCEKGLPKKYR